MDGETRGGRQVVRCVQAGEEAVALLGGVPQPGEGVQDAVGSDDERRLAVLDRGLDHRSLPPFLDPLGDQLRARGRQASPLPDRLGRPLDCLLCRLARLEARPLLGPFRVVALAPAEVGLATDQPLQFVEAVQHGLRPGRAAGYVDVDRHELVGALDDGVVGEHAPGRRAGAHRHHPLRLEHLVVDPADDRSHLDRDPARRGSTDPPAVAWPGTPRPRTGRCRIAT